ncbi:MAG: N-acetyltransferase [Chloroflexi bacterium]|nr:N-acetyltransferase [Chloroflexota bacterium]
MHGLPILPTIKSDALKREGNIAPAGAIPVLRAAHLKDVESITALINHYAALGEMLPRKEESVRQHIQQFIVAEANHKVVACGALHHWDARSAEIRSLAVAEQYAGQGLGTQIVKELDEHGAQMGYEYAFALTLKVRFFEKLGYAVVSKSVLPQKIWGDCIICPFLYNCRETAVYKPYRAA